jgi:DNA repair ATPase RecN
MGTSKISDIKDTASDTVEILRQLGTPGVQETLDKARTMTITVKEIMETMKSAEWVQNLENIRKMMDNMNSSSLAMQNTVRELKESGVLDEAKSFMQSAKKTMDSFGGSGQGPGTKQDIHEVVVSFREMIDSFKLLTDELKAVAVESKRPGGTVNELEQTVRDVSSAYRTAKRNVAPAST